MHNGLWVSFCVGQWVMGVTHCLLCSDLQWALATCVEYSPAVSQLARGATAEAVRAQYQLPVTAEYLDSLQEAPVLGQ